MDWLRSVIPYMEVLVLLYVVFIDVAARVISNKVCLLLAALAIVRLPVGEPQQLFASVYGAVVLFVLLLLVAFLRIVELQISQRHQREMVAHGAAKVNDPRFRWMVLLHTSILLGAAVEVVFLHRPFYPFFAAICFAVFVGANAIRWWVIRTMGEHWNVQVMNSTGMGVITSGPFQYVRHPNYASVFEVLLALPLIHSAWITAAFGTAAHILVLSERLAIEERVLFADVHYREAMSGKPLFLPGLF